MTTVHRGLGKGIGALIPARPDNDEPVAETGGPASSGALPESAPRVRGAFYAELAVSAISPNPRQPRADFDQEAMAELVASIRAVGLLQPVVVRATSRTSYELIMGERRWRAVQAAGLATIAAIVKETSDDAMLRDALLENLHRAELNPLEEAAAYQQLLDDFGSTHEELASRIGRSRPHITNTIRLLRLSAPVQRRVAAGVLSAGHARALLGVDGEQDQDRLAHRAVAEGISVRGLEEIVALSGPSGPRRTARRRPPEPELVAIADELSERLDTRCQVVVSGGRGRLVIDFAGQEDLVRIASLIGPAAP